MPPKYLLKASVSELAVADGAEAEAEGGGAEEEAAGAEGPGAEGTEVITPSTTRKLNPDVKDGVVMDDVEGGALLVVDGGRGPGVEIPAVALVFAGGLEKVANGLILTKFVVVLGLGGILIDVLTLSGVLGAVEAGAGAAAWAIAFAASAFFFFSAFVTILLRWVFENVLRESRTSQI